MKKFLILMCYTIFLSGCSNTVSYQYKDKTLSDSQISKIRKSDQNSLWQPYISDYLELDKANRDWKSVGSHLTYFPTALNVLPGKYAIRFYCATGSTYAYPTAKFNAEAGYTYESRCFNAEGGQVGVELKAVKSSQSQIK
jgi:uncharacterized protein YceK